MLITVWCWKQHDRSYDIFFTVMNINVTEHSFNKIKLHVLVLIPRFICSKCFPSWFFIFKKYSNHVPKYLPWSQNWPLKPLRWFISIQYIGTLYWLCILFSQTIFSRGFDFCWLGNIVSFFALSNYFGHLDLNYMRYIVMFFIFLYGKWKFSHNIK